MKFNKLPYIVFGLILISVASCSEDFLDQVPDDRQTIEEVFQKKQLSEEFLANVYSYLFDESSQWEGSPWSGNVDEMHVAWGKYPIYRLNVGNWGPSNPVFERWGHYYDGIRAATYFINNIGGNAELQKLDSELIEQYKAEAKFLRAYYYFMLMNQYGPVVIIGENMLAVDASKEDIQLARSPYDSCVAYVVNELDAAAKALPLVHDNQRDFGRITKGIALGVKSRVLLYAASPLYNGNPDYASFTNPDGTALISQTYDREKWKIAANAAKAVIDLGLYELYVDPSEDPVESYRGVHLKPWNSECIFVRKDNNLAGWDVHCSIRRAGGWSGLGPVQELVDSYFMKDGLSTNESPLYSEDGFTNGISNMYVNREPRFYASILYNGRKYKGGAVTGDSVTVDFTYNGADGKKDGGEDYTHTGYLVYKNVSPETNRLTGVNNSRPYVYMRLGEIYLNYAEALAEYGGNENEAITYLNLIRERAGIPVYGDESVTVPTGADLIEAIRDERRVELAFENHRWFDVRRWKIAGDVMGDVHGMDVNADGEEFYNRSVVANYAWKNAYYFWPISQYELDRSTKIVQNPGW
ncbi:MAG: RagB/SusD family nutrient uptake outer membrane protein [Salinivirgaceae bacterium]|nr:RagB/SusD family nutrient uptake outer membrane protein [Salinivirgaceae bacterium]